MGNLQGKKLHVMEQCLLMQGLLCTKLHLNYGECQKKTRIFIVFNIFEMAPTQKTDETGLYITL